MSGARCACGAVGAGLSAAPLFAIACHCRECRRRTGAAFGAGAYFARAAVRPFGEPTEHLRRTDAGHAFRSRFCPRCGTTVWWTIDERPDLAGVAIGALDEAGADAAARAPLHSLFERTALPWVRIDCAAERHQAGYPAA